MLLKRNSKRILIYVFFILSILYLLLYLKPTLTDSDENFTLTLIRHSYIHIIYLDSLDVHPPLYYLILKFFVNVTTFWTSYFPIKVLSARFMSVVISIITFIFLRKITRIFNILNNIYIQWIIFVICPNVLGPRFSDQQFVNIRMYALAALFIVISFYVLLKFMMTMNNKYLILSTIFITLATYTHYYAAIFGGLLLIYYFLMYIFKHKYFISFKLFISGVFVILMFIPWIPIFISQMDKPDTYWMSLKMELMEVTIFILILLLFAYPIIKHFKDSRSHSIFRKQIIILSYLIGVTFIFSMGYTFIRGPIFQYRYMYPVIIIYEFIGANISFKYRKLYKNYLMFLFIVLISIVGLSATVQLKWDYYSIQSIKTYNCWSQDNRNKVIHIYTTIPKNQIDDSSYIPILHNKFIVSHNASKSFKSNATMYTYRSLFKSSIKRVKFK